MSSKSDIKTNMLAGEKSPYLVQHANNPVEWYPWGRDAFSKASEEDKPIFLSIGYSTCHWCHVMAHESFEDPEVARLMNDTFVNIKVDREERPDIDGAYMTAAQVLTGTGGWPLTIIMTPEKKPFFAATYIPKEDRAGRVGMLSLVPQVKELWEKERHRAVSTAQDMTNYLAKLSKTTVSGESITQEAIKSAYGQLVGRFDKDNGGFSKAPKFPTPHNIIFLLRHWKKTGNQRAILMVEKTLNEMRKGGVYDHLGYGFHRYSTDHKWLVPHFEKMLYDQAMLAVAYTEAYQATKNDSYKGVAREILTYVLRDMTSKEGGFYSAEDADSEGVEGKFYVWRKKDILKILPKDLEELIIKVFNIEEEGNYLEEAIQRKTGENILHMRKSLEEISRDSGIKKGKLEKDIHRARELLLKERNKRVRPGLDDKILCDWNGLMIGAFAKASRAFDEKKFADAAKGAADFIIEKMADPRDGLLHTYKDGEARVNGFLEDYAFLIWGLIELYEAVLDPIYLDKALSLLERMIQDFWDEGDGGFFHTPRDGEELIVRKKEVYDGAYPSGNSMAMIGLLMLSRLTARNEFEARALKLGKAFSKTVNEAPGAYTFLLSAAEFQMGVSNEVVIIGDPKDKNTKEMLRKLNNEYLPGTVVLLVNPGDNKSPKILKIAPFTENYKQMNGKTTAYVCSNYTCKEPTTEPNEMIKQLKNL